MSIALGLLSACVTSTELPGASLDTEDATQAPEQAPCHEGDERECHETLAEHNGILSCYDGIQICDEDGSWGTCGSGEARNRPFAHQSLPGLRLKALTTSADCDDNPCDPTCQSFGDLPDAARDDNIIVRTSTFKWETGSLTGYPPGLVKKGLKEPCSGGFDCQFNTQCINPTSGECARDKCEAGDALFSECDPCVEMICANNPECCSDTGGPCEHGIAEVGAPLKVTCDPCVALICEAFPSCCNQTNGSWDEGCVAEVENTCGIQTGCCEGEVGYGGHCYYLETDNDDWPDAREDCQSRGDGWDLVSIGSEAENTFVYDLNSDRHTWIGLTEGNGLIDTGRDWVWSNGDPSGAWNEFSRSGLPYANFPSWEPDSYHDCARMNDSEGGTWDERDCDNDYDYICEGPPLCPGGPVPPEAPPAECEHDPCQTGAALKANCDVCVQAVCEEQADCCDDAWTEECVELIATECTAECECAEDEQSYEGHCYTEHHSGRSWWQALDECRERDGWDLVSIGDDDENDFIRSLNGSNDTWIAFTEEDQFISGNNRWVWTNGDPGGYWRESNGSGGIPYVNWTSGEPDGSGECARMRENTNGRWADMSCWNDYDYICEGPASRLSEFTPIEVENSGGGSSGGGQSGGSVGGAGVADPEWTSECVDMVASVCDARCDVPDTQGTGQCVPWYPGQTDSSCAGVDLAVAVPCDDNIPVCNHGTVEAPAGVRIVHFPANSQQYPKCEPDQTHPQMYECYTDEPIPPGECINVTTCPHMVGNREIMVNPEGAAQVAECSCQDNWSLYSGGTCGPPICSGGTNAATLETRPIDIIIAIDNSASMEGEIVAVQQRINQDFAEIIENSGVDYRVIMVSRYGNVHIQNFGGGGPYDSAYAICVGAPLSNLSCPATWDSSTPDVSNKPPRFYHHSTDIGSRDAWCKLIDSYDSSDPYPASRSGWDPVASNGWRDFVREDAFKVFVVITDDAPGTNSSGSNGQCRSSTGFTNDLNGADNFDEALRTLAPSQFGVYDPSDPDEGRNYAWYSIVGMAGNHVNNPTPLEPEEDIETLCCQGDGSRVNCPNNNNSWDSDGVRNGVGYQHLSRMTDGLRYPSCYNDNFDDVFNAIAEGVIDGSRISCNFTLENEGSFDIDTATVLLQENENANPEELTRAANLASCGANAWYLPDESIPSQVALCPLACEEVQANPDALLSVAVGCLGDGYDPVTFSEVYGAECNFDEMAQWGFFSLETTTPGDSSVVVRIRTGETEEGLGEATFVDLATLNTENGNSICSGPDVDGCPFDLYEALSGAPLAHLAFLEIEVTVNPTSDGRQLPSIDSWALSYSCVDAR